MSEAALEQIQASHYGHARMESRTLQADKYKGYNVAEARVKTNVAAVYDEVK
jgi:hypothetical protein